MTETTVSENPAEADEQETMEQRGARIDLEHQALASDEPDALKSRILHILAGHQYAQLRADGYAYEHALLKYAAATTKAVALALAGVVYVNSNEPFDTVFDSKDAALVLCGLSALLEAGPALLNTVESATPKTDGGTS